MKSESMTAVNTIIREATLQPTSAELKLLGVMRRYGPHCDFTIRKRATRAAPQGALIDVEISFKEPISFANNREFYPQVG